jgi:hypothetical protein
MTARHAAGIKKSPPAPAGYPDADAIFQSIPQHIKPNIRQANCEKFIMRRNNMINYARQIVIIQTT